MNDGKSDLMDVKLVPLTADDHFEEDEQIISRETIERSIDNGEAYRIMLEARIVGGVIIT